MAGAMQRRKSAATAATLRPAVQWVGAFVVSVSIATFAFRIAQPQAETISGDEAPVLAADTALGEAIRRGDKTAARRLLTLQFSFIDADGRNRVRKDFLLELKGAASSPAGDAKVRLYGLLAMVTGHRNSANDTEVFFLDVWAKQKGTWRALLMQEVMTATSDAPGPATGATGSATDLQYVGCRNPCQTVPYRARSPAEQDIVLTFQAIENAAIAHDAAEWGKRVADEFARYATDQSPVSKSDQIATIERQKETNADVTAGEIETMRLAVYGDGAAMTALQTAPDNSRPPYRAARIWVRRNGQWLMAISVHTEVK